MEEVPKENSEQSVHENGNQCIDNNDIGDEDHIEIDEFVEDRDYGNEMMLECLKQLSEEEQKSDHKMEKERESCRNESKARRSDVSDTEESRNPYAYQDADHATRANKDADQENSKREGSRNKRASMSEKRRKRLQRSNTLDETVSLSKALSTRREVLTDECRHKFASMSGSRDKSLQRSNTLDDIDDSLPKTVLTTGGASTEKDCRRLSQEFKASENDYTKKTKDLVFHRGMLNHSATNKSTHKILKGSPMSAVTTNAIHLYQELKEKETKQSAMEDLLKKLEQDVEMIRKEKRVIQSTPIMSQMMAEDRKESASYLKQNVKDLTEKQEVKERNMTERGSKISLLKEQLKCLRKEEEKQVEEKDLEIKSLKHQNQKLKIQVAEAVKKVKLQKTKMNFFQHHFQVFDDQREKFDVLMDIIHNLREKIDRLTEKSSILDQENSILKKKLKEQGKAKQRQEKYQEEQDRRLLDLHQKWEEHISTMREFLALPDICAKTGKCEMDHHKKNTPESFSKDNKESMKERKVQDEIQCRLKGFQDKKQWQQKYIEMSLEPQNDDKFSGEKKTFDIENYRVVRGSSCKENKSEDTEDTMKYFQCIKQSCSGEEKELKVIKYLKKEDPQACCTSHTNDEIGLSSSDSPVFLTEAPELKQKLPEDKIGTDVSLDMVVKTMEKSEILLKEIASFVDKLATIQGDIKEKKNDDGDDDGIAGKPPVKCIQDAGSLGLKEKSSIRPSLPKYSNRSDANNKYNKYNRISNNDPIIRDKSNNRNINLGINRIKNQITNNSSYISNNNNNTTNNYISSNRSDIRNNRRFIGLPYKESYHKLNSKTSLKWTKDRKLGMVKMTQRQSRSGISAIYGGIENEKSWRGDTKKGFSNINKTLVS